MIKESLITRRSYRSLLPFSLMYMENIDLSCCQYVHTLSQQGQITPKVAQILLPFFQSYEKAALANGYAKEAIASRLKTYADLIALNLAHPPSFAHFHHRCRQPFDYYSFGLSLIEPLIDTARSFLLGEENLQEIASVLRSGENVILLANHQTEPDPQIISLSLKSAFPSLGEEMIFVAGNRVIQDPLAIPFSLGCNLVCIYSKKYIDHPPEDKQRKLSHNQRSLKALQERLNQGGACIYVAPSGGRDRKNRAAIVEVAPFDSASTEMFWLLGQQAQKKTHFYPLALATYDILPPPDGLLLEIGEERQTSSAPIALNFGQRFASEAFAALSSLPKKEYRQAKTQLIYQKVKELYDQLQRQLAASPKREG